MILIYSNKALSDKLAALILLGYNGQAPPRLVNSESSLLT